MSRIKNMVKDITVVKILTKLEEKGKGSRAGINNLLVWYTISGHKFVLPCN